MNGMGSNEAGSEKMQRAGAVVSSDFLRAGTDE